MPAYDDQNIFAKILRGEIPNKTVMENDFVLAFEDIAPQKPVHILLIPKGAYTDIADFAAKASTQEIQAYYQALNQIVEDKNLKENGFRAIANTGEHGGQEVPHFHTHILGGAPVGKMINP